MWVTLEMTMGLVIPPPPFEFGTDCPKCTPALWAVGETPKFMYAYFSDIINCGVSPHDAPNGVTFLLQQNPLNLCEWVHDGDVWHVDFDPKVFGPNQSRVRLLDHHGFSFFIGTGAPCAPEVIRFVNNQGACLFAWAGASGFCLLDWSGILLDVIEELGIDRKPKLMRESRYVDDTDIVYKLCSLYQRTNLRVLMNL